MVDNYEFRITLWEQKICLLKRIGRFYYFGLVMDVVFGRIKCEISTIIV